MKIMKGELIMEIMNKIDKLMSRVNTEDKIIVGNITICLTEYVTLVAKKEAKADRKSVV